MTIYGLYEKDENFTTIYYDGKLYTIAINGGDWGCLPVGGQDTTGHILTQDEYDRRRSACVLSGTFELSDEM